MSRRIRRIIASAAIMMTAFGASIALSAPASADAAGCLRYLQVEGGYIITGGMVDACFAAQAVPSDPGRAACNITLFTAGILNGTHRVTACLIGSL